MAAPKSSATRRRRALKPASPVKIVGDYGLTKKQLAETIGLAPEALYKRERLGAAKTQSRLREMNEILMRVEREDAFASELLHSQRFERLSHADHGLSTELVLGVLRWRSRLDAVIASASSQQVAKLDAEVLNSLRLGVYQLDWLERVPARAAINESVELV